MSRSQEEFTYTLTAKELQLWYHGVEYLRQIFRNNVIKAVAMAAAAGGREEFRIRCSVGVIHCMGTATMAPELSFDIR